MFSAAKNTMQGLHRKKGKKGRKNREANRGEEARRKVLGKKKKTYFLCPSNCSELEFSFEKSLDSYERMLYGDVTVSSKRVCMGRVEVVQDVEGVVSHVAKEIDEEDEEYVQKGAESIGEEKGIYGASAASEEEDRRAK